MWTLWQDLRYSARLLLKHPGFTLTAIGVLTLGIGVNAGIFGIINGLMLRPLVGADAPGEVVGVYSQDRTTERGYRAFSYPGFDRRARRRWPVRAASPRTTSRSSASPRTTPRVRRWSTSSATRYFETLGVAPVYGRDFTLEEERPGSRGAPGHRQLHATGSGRLRSRHPQADRPHQRPGLRHRRRGAGGLQRHHRRSSAPSISCRSACTTRSKTTSIRAIASR